MPKSKKTKKIKVPRPFAGGRYTEAMFRAFIKRGLRTQSLRWWGRTDALKRQAAGKQVNRFTKRTAKHWTCENCGLDWPNSHIEVHHQPPVEQPYTGETFLGVNWNQFLQRLFVEASGYQVVCKDCHLLIHGKESHEIQN